MIDSSDESGNIRIKRYKIKNWDQIIKGDGQQYYSRTLSMD